MENIKGSLVQIIPAPPNLYNKTEDTEGDIYTRIVCIGLTNDGYIHFCDTMDDGQIEPIEYGDGDIYEYDAESDSYRSVSGFRNNNK